MGKLQYGDRQSVDHQRGGLANYNVRLEHRRLSPLRRALRALIKPSHLSSKKGTCDRIMCPLSSRQTILSQKKLNVYNEQSYTNHSYKVNDWM